MMASNSNHSTNYTKKIDQLPWQEEKIGIPDFLTSRKIKADPMLGKSIDGAVKGSIDNMAIKDSSFSTDSATCSKTSSIIDHDEKKESSEAYIQRWEREALSHFRSSAWEGQLQLCLSFYNISILILKHLSLAFALAISPNTSKIIILLWFVDVIGACKHVLRIPGQSETNFDVLYEIGYAHMRLGEYETAVKYFMGAHRIDSQRVSLRLVMRDLRRKMTLGPWRNTKRNREEVVGQSEQHKPQQDSKKACTTPPKAAWSSSIHRGPQSFILDAHEEYITFQVRSSLGPQDLSSVCANRHEVGREEAVW